MLRIARSYAHSACGWVAYRLGWHMTARRQFERVLLLRGAHFSAYVSLGRIAFDLGDYSGWRREFEHARRTDPSSFARLRHPMELFEPRLAGTQCDYPAGLSPTGHSSNGLSPTGHSTGHSSNGLSPTGFSSMDLSGGFGPGGFSPTEEGFEATDARATWRAQPFADDADRPRADDGEEIDSRDGFPRGSDLPLAPGFDQLLPGQHPDSPSPGGHGARRDGPHDERPPHRGPAHRGPAHQGPAHQGNGSMPDASLSHDDFASAFERRRFQLRRPIDRKEIGRCNLDELARRLIG